MTRYNNLYLLIQDIAHRKRVHDQLEHPKYIYQIIYILIKKNYPNF